MELLIGCDPEVFVRTTDGRILSAHGMIPGTKYDPWEVDKGFIQVDGTAAEFNIHPASSEDEFITNIHTVMKKLRSMACGYATPEEKTDEHKTELAIIPVAHFDPVYFASLPARVLELGCEPDYSAYTGFRNHKPDASGKLIRTAAGHLHLGWTKDAIPHSSGHFTLCREIAKQLDVALFVPSLLWDNDEERRELYGQPGCFRPKKYGMEYRTLSNCWLKDDDLIRWVYSQANWAVKEFFKNNLLYTKYQLSMIPEELILALEKDGCPPFPWGSDGLEFWSGMHCKKVENGACC